VPTGAKNLFNMTDDKNRKTYANAGVVNHYAQLKELQPAEKMLLERLRDLLPQMKMLDIGVGGGRTTQYFCQEVAEYTGIDYSDEMIEACKQRFPASTRATFEVCDAREMSRFEDNTFDLILFSFNGIDYVSLSDRLQILKEVSRVGKSGGYFYFSSHNLQGLERVFEVRSQFSCNPITTYANLVMWAILRVLNMPMTLRKIRALSNMTVRDESHNFRLETYYIRPAEQVRQLDFNFRDIEVYSWRNELELASEIDRSSNSDVWLYYLCVVK
jgi:ubiquinone/menaquinone biosynthesis C-methylase UbiE